MTQCFDEWYAKNYVHWLKYEENYGEFSYRAYKAGVQSRQGEVDELQSKLEVAENNLNNAFKTIRHEQEYQDRLQKSIYDVLTYIESSEDITHGAYRIINKLLNLKEETK